MYSKNKRPQQTRSELLALTRASGIQLELARLRPWREKPPVSFSCVGLVDSPWKRKHSQARSSHGRIDGERKRKAGTNVCACVCAWVCVCACVCVCASDRGLSAYLKEPLCQALSTAGQEAKQQAARLRADNTVALHWLGWEGVGGEVEEEEEGYFLGKSGGIVSQQTHPAIQPPHSLHPPPPPPPENKRRRNSNLNICVSLWEGGPQILLTHNPPLLQPPHTHTRTHTHTNTHIQ